MTRPYIGRKLLEHGPLTFAEFHAITGWQKWQAKYVLERLVSRREVKKDYLPIYHQRYSYRLAE